MAVPRNRTSNARKNSRRSHMAKKGKNLLNCTGCQKLILSHKMCPFCGLYRERSYIDETSAEQK